jgi:transcriptional regulator with XRE-family HTH domain
MNALQARRLIENPAACRAIRIAARATLAEIAVEIPATPSAVSRWERGERKPRTAHAVRYAEILEELGRR